MLTYDKMDFLVNRSQFSASLFPAKETAVKSPLTHIRSVIPYNKQYVLIFDLDDFLQSRFYCRSLGQARMLLIADLDNFPGHTRQILENFRIKGSRVLLSGKHLALKVNSGAEIKSLSLDELKLIPALLRKGTYRHGLLGMRFAGKSRIQYFIDCEIIIGNYITERRGKYESIIGR